MKSEKRENFSLKRSAILKTLQSTTVHPTADWVYNKLKPKYPNLSLGTVYRNLKKFCETGKAVSVGVINGQEHFDGDISPHTHMVCTSCGCITDISDTFIERTHIDGILDKYGHKITHAEILFRGICNECMDILSEEDQVLEA